MKLAPGIRRFVPNSSTAGRLMGLRGKVPPAGADLLGAGPYHLPLPEGEDVTRGSGNGPLTGIPASDRSPLQAAREWRGDGKC
jgi:hypothetical protein